MGKTIEVMEPVFRKFPVNLTVSGGFFAVFLIFGTWAVTSFLLEILRSFYSPLGIYFEIIMIYFCISSRSLEQAAMGVYEILKQNNLNGAKEKLAMIVGRDVRNLSETGVARAAVETVAENLVDGVISPLFFASIGGAPLVMAYKMVNTLDSMIGYKNEIYKDFGKTAAHIDDAANYIPARLSVHIIALGAQMISGKGEDVKDTARAEGSNHSSPNSGYPEAAFAGALDVKLGGPNIYHGMLVSKPYIGTWLGQIHIEDIKKACDLMVLSSCLWFVMAWGTDILRRFIF